MNDLVRTVGLESVIEAYGFADQGLDFEGLYSSLSASGARDDILYTMESIVHTYFAQMELPDNPTLYDHIVLSLRHKDLIATFNWDPLLPQAMGRVARRFGEDMLPQTLYLHGNVSIGYCGNHEPPTMGFFGNNCGKCGAPLCRSDLLFPVSQKNYTEDPHISGSWEHLKKYLRHAFIFTVFGYSAPKTDIDAVTLITDAWGPGTSRELEQIEMIDIRPARELYASWESIICREHYGVMNDFYQSLAAQHPRRSCEDFWEAIMQCDPQVERPIPRDASWAELEQWAAPLIEQERRNTSQGT